MNTDERLQRIETAIERLTTNLHGTEERLTEQMRDMQTELLKAFLPAHEQARSRDAALEARQNAVETRVAITETRLAEIEKRLLLNPPAA